MKPLALKLVAFLTVATGASAQIPAGGEFRVNTYTTGFQWYPRASATPDGGFLVVWSDVFQGGARIGARRYDPSGVAQGGEFQLNSATTERLTAPELAIGGRGDFIAVWESVPHSGPGPSSIRGRRFAATGAPIGGEFVVNSFTTAFQGSAHVGRAADGSFVVSWTTSLIGGVYSVVARRFASSGAPIGAEFPVDPPTNGTQRGGDVAVAANGDFVVVWEDLSNRDGSQMGIFGQRFDGGGTRLGGPFQVNTHTPLHQLFPSVSQSPAGGFVVAWTSYLADGSDYAVSARRFDAGGNPLGNEFIVNSYTTGGQISLRARPAHDAQGNFVVTWHGPGDGSPQYFRAQASFAQRFSASGARRGGEFRVNTYTTNAQYFPSAASDAVGNVVVVWNSNGQDGSDLGVFGQRFGGLRPAALSVDTLGNRVLEPGESIDVRPAWRNDNGGAQAVTGALGNITGPSGATYAITDAAGDYGTVADGATSPCNDCYAVSVSNPPARPATHWDASAVETIAPDAQGQQQGWLLHVGKSFSDVPPSNGFYRFVETLLHHGVTGGCAGATYCPAQSTTRAQMAVFALVAREGPGFSPPACTTPMFPDVPASSPFCRWIEELARRGVVSGCGNLDYCPSQPVTREQMAIFVLRTVDPTINPPACTIPIYSDVPATSAFCRYIEELTRRGVVTGCGGGNYCPAGPVTREQMAVFISVTFGLTLYGP